MSLPGGKICSGSQDHSVRIWDLGACGGIGIGNGTGRHLKNQQHQNNQHPKQQHQNFIRTGPGGHAGWVRSLVSLPDGKMASASNDGLIFIWDTITGKNVKILQGKGHGSHRQKSSLLLLSDGTRMAVGSHDNSIEIWNYGNGSAACVVGKLKGHSDAVLCLALLPDGRLVSGSNDNSIKIWDVIPSDDDSCCLKTLKGHSDAVYSLGILPNGRIISGSLDHSIRIWDPYASKCLKILPVGRRHKSVYCVCVLPDGRVASGCEDGTIIVWDAASLDT